MLEQLPTPSISEMYPGAKDAVEFHEKHLFTQEMMKIIIERGLTPEQVVKGLAFTSLSTQTIFPDGYMTEKDIHSQILHPDFLRYIKAKMGSV